MIIKAINIEFGNRVDFPAHILANVCISPFLNIHKIYPFNTATISHIIAGRSILWRQFVRAVILKSSKFTLVAFNTKFRW